jgi:UDP-glucose:(heptosyl)LPS alpha-1,3-glucosyltransferase
VRLAFCILKYFPYGGLQRDFLRIAETCLRRGHAVDVYTRIWQGPMPEGMRVACLPSRGFSNHGSHRAFYEAALGRIAAGGYDAVVGFNKMPGLDVYFAGDVCFAERAQRRSAFYRMLPRCRAFAAMEEAVFRADAGTQILLLVESDREVYARHYGTSEDRMHVLPPDVPADRHAPADRAAARDAARASLGLAADERMLLMLGSGFKIKGLDRTLLALASLPEDLRAVTALKVIGQDNPRPFMRQARSLGLDAQVEFLGDLLLHPAYYEAAGTVLLEAMAAGTPVLTTDRCGFAPHVERGQGGIVLSSPFAQAALDAALLRMLRHDEAWGTHGMNYIRGIDVGSRAERAADVIEKAAARK